MPLDNGKLRRQHPDEETLRYRERYLRELRTVPRPLTSSAPPLGLEPGNKKLGQSGALYRSVFVWNLPSVVTCPAASPWCLCHCYNADPRTDVFPVEKWLESWALVQEQPSVVAAEIIRQLSSAPRPSAVRLHSSGDFFSVGYISFWNDIISSASDVDFWAYTRSWAIPELKTALEHLRTNRNLQLFASWDSTMPPPPADWRRSLVISSDAVVNPPEINGVSLPCPEETQGGPTCASCGYCIKRRAGDVIFRIH